MTTSASACGAEKADKHTNPSTAKRRKPRGCDGQHRKRPGSRAVVATGNLKATVSVAEVVFEKRAPGNVGAGLRGDAPECEFSARLSSRRPTSWRSPLSICLIAAA